ncbi:hypothetical protein BRO54_0292 [Geobacillus proteiniphilus]|uniref:Uncharacterized protein n=1 Tax=Geobacillus proteiniphilus TaxID=860353 RepID=A0A1Q5T931_9BACL|nr:hypothetical protein BRO54_0292 [Geobacillus proteiniphilus]
MYGAVGLYMTETGAVGQKGKSDYEIFFILWSRIFDSRSRIDLMNILAVR